MALLICMLFVQIGEVQAANHIQQASNGDVTGATYTSFSATFSSATQSGNAIIFGITYGNMNPTITAIDSQGNTYIQAVKTYDSRHNQGCAILYAVNISGSASTRVTVKFSGPVGYLALGIHEYSGVASLDVIAGNQGSGSSMSSGSATTTANGDLIFGCGVEDTIGHGDTMTAGPGFTKRVDLASADAYADEDQVQNSAGLAAVTWTLAPSSDWIAVMAAFRASGTGAGAGASTAPSISSVSPSSGPPGTPVAIMGMNFGGTQGTSQVTFGGMTATPTSWSATSIVAPVPAGATTGNVVVTLASNGVGFVVTTSAAPSIAGLSPTSGPVGTSVTISGTNFGSTQGTSIVKFNGTTATATSWSNTSIATSVPTGATTGNVTVTVGGQISNGVSFTVASPAPTITGVSPTSGPVGTSVTINGTNFGSTQGTSIVKFNGTAATATSWSNTSIATSVPTGATTGNVTVTVGGQISNGVSFTVASPAPTITGVSPASGPVGTSVTISGTNFGSTQGISTVNFNGTTATATSWSNTSIVASVPAGATTGNVTVTVGGQTSNSVSFAVSASTGSGATPTLVQHVSQSSTQGNAVTTYQIRLPNATQSGNCLIVGVSNGASAVIPTLTDDQGNAYTRAISNADGNQRLTLFVALNVIGGAQNITVHFSSATNWVAALTSEFYNVATANAFDGSHAQNGSGTIMAAGSFTPATPGDLIYQFAVQDTTAEPIISFTQGSSPWNLLSTDVMDSMAAQYQVQAASGAINPTMSMSPANSWNSVAIALKSAPSGGDIPGIHIVHLQHNALPSGTNSPALQFPSTGNLIVLSWIGAPGHDVTSVTDGNGNSYNPIGSPFGNFDSGDNQLFYAPSAMTSTTMIGPNLITTGIDYSGSTVQLFDVTAAASSPFDSTSGLQTASGKQLSSGNIIAVAITPNTPDGLVISSIGVASNTVNGISPGNFLSSVVIPETSPWPNDENNGWAVHYNSSTSPITFVWSITGGPAGNWASIAAAFKADGH